MNKQTVYVPAVLENLYDGDKKIRLEIWSETSSDWLFYGYATPRQAVILDDGEVERLVHLLNVIKDTYNTSYAEEALELLSQLK